MPDVLQGSGQVKRTRTPGETVTPTPKERKEARIMRVTSDPYAGAPASSSVAVGFAWKEEQIASEER
eukprot:2266795-Karenia_brevis.AAC.1